MGDKQRRLEEQIEVLRKQLNLWATERGYTHEDTIKISQKLDELLNELHRLSNK